MEEKNNDLDIKDEDLKEDDFSSEELESEDVDWKQKAQELKGIAKRRAKQLSKAKAKLGDYEVKLKDLTPEPKHQNNLEKTKPNEDLLKKYDNLALKTEGIKDTDEVELVNKWKTDTGREIEDVLGNKIFQAELQSLRDEKANVLATSAPKGGGGGGGQAKNTPEYWIAKGTPPTAEQVPDRKTRAKIARAMMKNASTGGKTFYND